MAIGKSGHKFLLSVAMVDAMLRRPLFWIKETRPQARGPSPGARGPTIHHQRPITGRGHGPGGRPEEARKSTSWQYTWVYLHDFGTSRWCTPKFPLKLWEIMKIHKSDYFSSLLHITWSILNEKLMDFHHFPRFARALTLPARPGEVDLVLRHEQQRFRPVELAPCSTKVCNDQKSESNQRRHLIVLWIFLNAL